MKPIGFAYRDSNGTTLIGNFDTSSEEAIPGLERYERLPLYSQSQVKEMLEEMLNKADQRLENLNITISTMTEDELKARYDGMRQGFSDSVKIISHTAAKYGIKLD